MALLRAGDFHHPRSTFLTQPLVSLPVHFRCVFLVGRILKRHIPTPASNISDRPLRHAQEPGGSVVAEAASAVCAAFHSHQLKLAEPRGAMVWRVNAESGSARCIFQRATFGTGHRSVSGCLEFRSQAIHLDSQTAGHPAENRAGTGQVGVHLVWIDAASPPQETGRMICLVIYGTLHLFIHRKPFENSTFHAPGYAPRA